MMVSQQIFIDLHIMDKENGVFEGYCIWEQHRDEDACVLLTEEEALAISTSCCGQVSYRNIDNSYDKALKVYERLGINTDHAHLSPTEHQAKPMQEADYRARQQYTPVNTSIVTGKQIGRAHV